MWGFSINDINKTFRKGSASKVSHQQDLTEKWKINVGAIFQILKHQDIRDSIIFWDTTFGRHPFSDIDVISRIVNIDMTLEDPGPVKTKIAQIYKLNTQKADDPVFTKATFILGGRIKSWELTLKKIVSFFKTNNIDILTSQKNETLGLGKSIFEFYKGLLSEWCSVKLSNVSIMHKSILFNILTPHSFFLNADHETHALGVCYGNLIDEEFDMLTSNAQNLYRSLAQRLIEFGQLFDYNLEVWAVGNASRSLAQCLTNLQMNERVEGSEKVSLILMDRALDFVAPCDLGVDNMTDRYYQIKAMESLSGTDSQPVSNDDIYINSFLKLPLEQVVYNPHFDTSSDALDAQLKYINPTKDAIAEIYDDLEFLIEFPSGMKRSQYMNYVLEQIKVPNHTRMDLFTSYKYIVSCGLLASLHNDNAMSENSYIGREELLLIKDTLAHGIDLDKLLEYAKEYSDSKAPHKLVTLTSFLLLIFSLKSPSPNLSQDSRLLSKLKKVISKMIDALPSVESISWAQPFSELLQDETESERKAIIADLVDRLLNSLEDVVTARYELQDYDELYVSKYIPALKQIAQHISSTEETPKLNDLKRLSFSVSGMIKSGISIIGLRNLPTPTERNVIIFFVVGGITFSEIRHIEKLAKTVYKDKYVLVGSTHMATLVKIHDLFFTHAMKEPMS